MMCYPSITIEAAAMMPIEMADQLLSARAALVGQKPASDQKVTRGFDGSQTFHITSLEELVATMRKPEVNQ